MFNFLLYPTHNSVWNVNTNLQTQALNKTCGRPTSVSGGCDWLLLPNPVFLILNITEELLQMQSIIQLLSAGDNWLLQQKHQSTLGTPKVQ